jgi:hypothetical protein
VINKEKLSGEESVIAKDIVSAEKPVIVKDIVRAKDRFDVGAFVEPTLDPENGALAGNSQSAGEDVQAIGKNEGEIE